jgi:acyl-coenzyme A thioesterase PaaI-like protein
VKSSVLCFGCGRDNEAGLQLQFKMLDDGRLETHFRPRAIHGGWEGVFHGGLMATLLDEAMLAHLHLSGVDAATASLEVRYAEAVRLGEALVVHAWEATRRGRLHEMVAEARRAESVVARARAKCLTIE